MGNFRIFSIVAGSFEICNLENRERIKIPAAGKLRYNNISPLVGDIVEIKNDLIVDIKERENELVRPKVANIDQVVIVMSIEEPKFSSFLIDKYLSIIEFKNIKPIIFITKSDLNENDAIYWSEKYKKMGYDVFLLGKEENLDHLHHLFTNKFTLFMGQSGVGKTTAINKLGSFNYNTQTISKALGRGKHTTRVTQIIDFLDGFLIDTPGFSSLEVPMEEIELAKSFKNFREFAQFCKYRSCLHFNENENDCAIKLALQNQEIEEFRYENYLKLLKEIKEKR
ncbi:ribosome small subunit-dependent GTPase A [Mycoplasmopsis edwardii]|nr:ribosome small subunit-dependent GTPase A [Mycoplasmopsis edwardii]